MEAPSNLPLELTNDDMLAVEREYCERSLSNLIKRAWRVLEPGQPYVGNWHIDALAEHFEAVLMGEITRLYLAVPPGSMKSLLSSVFAPTYGWVKVSPSLKTISASHSRELAMRDCQKQRRLVKSDWFQALWGDRVKISDDQDAKTGFSTTAHGFRQAAAITGLTGMRANMVICDDIMSVDDANSDLTRQAILQTFQEAVPTRLVDPIKSAIIVIQQRLHQEDVIGFIEANDLGYDGLVIPMEYNPNRVYPKTKLGFKDPRTEEGELMFPERFPREVVERDKKVMGSFATASQFDQLPIPRAGGLFKREWFESNTIDRERLPDDLIRVRGWDLAATEEAAKGGNKAAFTAGVLLGYSPRTRRYYLEHVERGRWSPAGVEQRIVFMAESDGKQAIQDLPLDPGQAGKSQIRYLVGALAGYQVKYGSESGSKVLRAEAVVAQAEIGNIVMVRGTWNTVFLDEATKFPFVKFKDQVDGLSRAFARLSMMARQIPDIPCAPIQMTDDIDLSLY